VLIVWIVLAVIVVSWAVSAFVALRRLGGARTVAGVVIHDPTDDTSIDAKGGVRSVQGADLDIPHDAFEGAWTATTLERLARTYWSFLSSCTLGLIRVVYTEEERFVVLLTRPFVLLRFQAPEYEMRPDGGVVRWRIEKGVLVARRGRGGDGYLEIDVRHLGQTEDDCERVHVEVEIANFYPQVGRLLSRFVYTNTQSRIHVLVTYGFLRRIARRELDQSVTGKYAADRQL
jgi:hypothetical protein